MSYVYVDVMLSLDITSKLDVTSKLRHHVYT
jgi:hypothetical protein